MRAGRELGIERLRAQLKLRGSQLNGSTKHQPQVSPHRLASRPSQRVLFPSCLRNLIPWWRWRSHLTMRRVLPFGIGAEASSHFPPLPPPLHARPRSVIRADMKVTGRARRCRLTGQPGSQVPPGEIPVTRPQLGKPGSRGGLFSQSVSPRSTQVLEQR